MFLLLLHLLPYSLTIFYATMVSLIIFSDKDIQFTSKFWTAFCIGLNITLKFSSPFHHQINGLSVRVNSVIVQYLRNYKNHKSSNQNNFFYLAKFSCKNSIQESSNHFPFFSHYSFLDILLKLSKSLEMKNLLAVQLNL